MKKHTSQIPPKSNSGGTGGLQDGKYKNILGLAMFLIGTACLLAINYLYKNGTINNETALGITLAVGLVVMALYWKYFRRKR